MSAPLRPLAVLAVALVVGLASACEGLSFYQAGQITVRNLSNDQTAVLAIIGDDFKSYPTLGPQHNTNAFTEVGGTYQVYVVMSTVDAQSYRNNLQILKHNVETIVDGSASNDEKTKYFAYLAQINSAISQAGQSGASCSGKITLNESTATNISVAVNWIPTLGSGSWSLTCGSN